jgi:hypothetical protein
MPPLLVALPVIIVVFVVVVIVVMAMLVIVTVVWLRVRLRIRLRIRCWRFRLRLRSRIRRRRRRLRSGRWAGVWLRWRNSPDQIKKAATAAALAVIRQRDGDAPLNVRGAGCQRQDQEKVFHHSFPNLSKAMNDLRYDFIKRSICSTLHALGSIRVSSSSRYTCSAVSTVCVSAASNLIAITAQASQ